MLELKLIKALKYVVNVHTNDEIKNPVYLIIKQLLIFVSDRRWKKFLN